MYPLCFKMSAGCGFLVIWIIMLQTHFPFATACLEDERSYLLDFKAGLNFSLPSWQGFNCCEWKGVACDYHTSHIIRLDLSAYGSDLRSESDRYKTREIRLDLSAKPYYGSYWDKTREIRLDLSAEPYNGSYWDKTSEISPSLFNLQHLQHLDLSYIYFNGISIPPELSKLQRLTFLKLSFAGFCGEVPLELGNMSSLRHLDISDNWQHNGWNGLTSSKFDVWVRNLRSLEFLEMSYVNLSMASKQWGEALSGLPNLTHIHLSECGLSGIIPDLLNLTRLSHLHMPYNSFPFELPFWFENVSSLVSLDLADCGLNDSMPSNFMPRSKLSNLVLSYNVDLKVNLSFFVNHSSSLVSLSLTGCNIGGVISPLIGNFSKLQTLSLPGNNLEGGIPSSFGSLSSLVSLGLSNNQLTGQIPPSLCQLPALVKLRLYDNQLSGTIPDSISKLASLQRLSLSSNRLTGNISLQLFDNLTRLQELGLSGNQLHINTSPSWVPQFSKLKFIRLGSCNIGGEIPAFLSQQYELEALDLSNNNIVGNVPTWLWNLPYLQLLNLSHNKLEGSLPRQMSHNLSVVDLHANRFYGTLPNLDFATNMLVLSDNEFNGSIPATIGTLHYLSLSGNNLTGEIPSSTCNDSSRLMIWDLSKNKLTGMIPSNIGSCSNLLVLHLAQNVLEGKIPEELGNLQSLHTLNLEGNRLEGIIPSSIANCRDLQVFNLGYNRFEGKIPVWIEKLTDLKILSLAFNKFRDRIPPQLMRLPNLQILDLSSNLLSGNIPQNLSKLSAMVNQSQSTDVQLTSPYSLRLPRVGPKYKLIFQDKLTVWIKGRATLYDKIIRAARFMDLSHNNLSGYIPSELGFLKGLISLNISKNNLSGTVPESLGAMVHLESLDLSENKLSGQIPSQLLNLNFLAMLNLSNNMLSGLIPQGKQFLTFDASSFQGNPYLYGPQLENWKHSIGLGSRENHSNSIVEDGDADVLDRWWAVGLGLSFGVGFAAIIAILCFHIKWRYRCFSLMDNFIYYLFEW